jgi:tetratricopeptide (TPR) repeat protein
MRPQLIVSVVMLLAIVAPASGADSPGAALLRQGIALRREQRNADALVVFEAAKRIEPSACALAQIGLAQQALGRFSDAERNLRAAVALAEDP